MASENSVADRNERLVVGVGMEGHPGGGKDGSWSGTGKHAPVVTTSPVLVPSGLANPLTLLIALCIKSQSKNISATIINWLHRDLFVGCLRSGQEASVST